MLISPGHLYLVSSVHLLLSLNFETSGFVLYEGENKVRVIKYRNHEGMDFLVWKFGGVRG